MHNYNKILCAKGSNSKGDLTVFDRFYQFIHANAHKNNRRQKDSG